MMTLFNNIGNWYVTYWDKTQVWADSVREWMRANPTQAGLGFVLACAVLTIDVVLMIKLAKTH